MQSYLDKANVTKIRAGDSAWSAHVTTAMRKCRCRACGNDIHKGEQRISYYFQVPDGRFDIHGHIHLMACEAVAPYAP